MKTISTILGVIVGAALMTIGAWAQANGDYRSNGSGLWSDATKWQRFTAGSWGITVTAPASGDGVITVRSPDSLTVTSSVTVDQVTISSGAVVNVRATMTINDGTGTDLTVNGTLENSNGTLTQNSGSTTSFGSGSIYRHSRNGGALPSGASSLTSWNANSTCCITGMTSDDPDNLNQTFGNLIWKCTGQTADATIDGNCTVQGDFTVTSTGSDSPQDDLIIVSGASITFTVGDDFVLSGGTLNLNSSASSSFDCTFNIGGDFTQSGTSTLTETGVVDADAIIHFTTGTHLYTFSGGTQSGTIDWFVDNGATLKMGTNLVGYDLVGSSQTCTGDFTASSGSTLEIGHAGGITSGTSNSGNVRVTGARTFSSGASYTYNGSVAQVTGSGIPTTVYSLQISNTSSTGVTLSKSVIISNTLSMTAGNIYRNGSSNDFSVTLGTGSSVLGTLVWSAGAIEGNFDRWFNTSTVSNVLFPLGGTIDGTFRSLPAVVSYTSAPTHAGVLSIHYETDYTFNGNLNPSPLTEAGKTITAVYGSGAKGFWYIIGASDINGGVYKVDLTGTGFNFTKTLSDVRVLRRDVQAGYWFLFGTHAAGTGTLVNPIGHRTNLTGINANVSPNYHKYQLADVGDYSLPVELVSFSGNLDNESVKLEWRTASETDNLGFDVVRSVVTSRGEGAWERVGFVPGHGTTAMPHQYAYSDDISLLSDVKAVKYQLKQVDADGSVTASDHILINMSDVRARPVLHAGYPNPTTGMTMLNYMLPAKMNVQLDLYDALGNPVRSLVSQVQDAGAYQLRLDFDGLAPGAYYCKLNAGVSTAVQPIMFVR